LAAEVIDRLAPLPFIAFFFPIWTWVVVAYHLLADGTPEGQSLGKRICRLRVIALVTKEPCGIARAMLRRLPVAMGQAAYCSWKFVTLAVAYELASLACVWLSPSGRRIEDYLTGTQVIAEGAYRQSQPVCAGCGRRMPCEARHCTNCGGALAVAEISLGRNRENEDA